RRPASWPTSGCTRRTRRRGARVGGSSPPSGRICSPGPPSRTKKLNSCFTCAVICARFAASTISSTTFS
ncbi:unnamed protein product, partial [Amoebophrya sp. A120]